jgi:PAS domain S-box-containing protein
MANPVVVHMFGYDTAEEFRKHPVMNLYADPAERQKISNHLIRDGIVSGVDVQFKKKNGELFWGRISVIAVPGPDGKIAYFDGVLEDIANRKRVDEALREANRKLHLLSGITRHDILNKISVLLGNLEIAKTKSHDPTMAAYIAKLESATMAIRDQIEFTRVYQDLGSHEPHWQRLDKVIFRLEVPRLFSLQVDLPHVEIFADPILEKVFYNLLDNSVTHGQNVTTITVSSHEAPEGSFHGYRRKEFTSQFLVISDKKDTSVTE